MKICSWNMENLFIFMDKYDGENLETIDNETWINFSLSSRENKHLGKVIECANVIKEIDADIYLMSEVGGRESLKNLNKFFLNNEYDVFVDEGNSKRGICVGFLVKKHVKPKFKSNKNMKLKDGELLSRDFSEIETDDYILLSIHLKSQLNAKNDPRGLKKRSIEIEALDSYIQSKTKPVIVGGDFNCQKRDPELRRFAKKLTDFHDLKKSSIEDRCSHIYFSSIRILNQFDYIFTSNSVKNIIDHEESYNYRFKNEYGDDMGLAETFPEKKLYPSDHYPVILKLKK